MIGTDFQVRVWQALLEDPDGAGAEAIPRSPPSIGAPAAVRAVGAAVGANPLSFVVPCHRALGKSGALTGYHWGLTRKRAILGWEAGQLAAGLTGRQALPISTPAASTRLPPSTTCSTARKNGVSM